MKTICIVLALLSSLNIGLTQSDLYCYDCDPQTNREQCGQPSVGGVQLVNCNNWAKQHPSGDPNSTLLCLSAYLINTGPNINNTGIYRGCRHQLSSVVNFCDFFKEETNSLNYHLTSCVTCNSSNCNNITFNLKGQPNGSSLSQTAFTILGISLLFVLFF